MTEWSPGGYVMGGIGLLNIGMVIYLVKIVIAPLAQVTKNLSESVRELYHSRDSHEVKIVAIETIHRIKGCDQPKGGKS